MGDITDSCRGFVPIMTQNMALCSILFFALGYIVGARRKK